MDKNPNNQNQGNFGGNPNYQNQGNFGGNPNYQNQGNFGGNAEYQNQGNFGGNPNYQNQGNFQGNPGYQNVSNQVNPNQINMNAANPFGFPQEYFNPNFDARINFNENHPAYNMLNQAHAAYIIQQVEWLEVLTGCETNNKYKVYIKTPNSRGKQKIFKCKEDSSWCDKNCWSSDCRPFNMKVKFSTDDNKVQEEKWDDQVALLQRPFKCTCWCINRPEMEINWFKPEAVNIGKIKAPFQFCDIKMDVYDNNSKMKYEIIASCCQCGFICRNGVCAVCSEVQMPIYKTENSNKVEANKDGHIRKYVKGALEELFTDADSFEITFPKDATPYDKFNLICAVLMIDYQYFEETADTNHHHHH